MVRLQRFLRILLLMLLPVAGLLRPAARHRRSASRIPPRPIRARTLAVRQAPGARPPRARKWLSRKMPSPRPPTSRRRRMARHMSRRKRSRRRATAMTAARAAYTAPPKTAKPPAPSPTTQPPPPPAAEAAPPAGGADPAALEAAGVAPGDKKFDVVPVFYGTDRAVEPDTKRLKFGSDRATSCCSAARSSPSRRRTRCRTSSGPG